MSVTATPAQVPVPVAREVPKPLRSRYLLVLLLPLVALVSAVLWSITVYAGAGSAAEGYARGTIPGQVSVEVHPGTWVVFEEATTRDFTVRVVAADGTEVPVRYIRGEGGYVYDFHGAQATAVAAFDVPVGVNEQYTVTSVGEADSQGSFAVGDDSQLGWSRVSLWATVALLVVNVGAAAAIVVVPIVRYRRRRAAVTQG
jgi:hypothetical protein